MTERMQPFWWFISFKEGMFDIRVFNMRYGEMAYIEDALVEIIQDSTVIKSGYTDENGKYTTVLGAGTYTIRISKAGYRTIEKTETLAYPTELMVNLPLEKSPIGRSGALLQIIVAEVDSPEMTTIYKVVTPTSKVVTMTSSYTAEVT